MRLNFKQRFFSWFDSYDIYDEAGNTVYTVEGQNPRALHTRCFFMMDHALSVDVLRGLSQR